MTHGRFNYPLGEAAKIAEKLNRQFAWVNEFNRLNTLTLGSAFSDSIRISSQLGATLQSMKTVTQVQSALVKTSTVHSEILERIRRVGDVGAFNSHTLKQIQKLGYTSPFKEVLEHSHVVEQLVRNQVQLIKQSDEDNLSELIEENQEDISESAHHIINEALTHQYGDIQELLNELHGKIDSQKEPRYKKALINIILPIILTLFSIFAGPSLHDWAISDRRAAIKHIQTQAKASVAKPSELKQYRLVTADVLRVRSGSKQSSEQLGLLYFGSIVSIVEKKRNWTLVEWQDPESEAFIRGWVFSRYLKKLN